MPVTTIANNAFKDNNYLTELQAHTVERVGHFAFSGCQSLTKITLSKATSLGTDAFYQCTSLNTISLPQATSLGQSAFAGCRSLTTVSLPKANRISSYAFSGCTLLKAISLPEATSLYFRAFSECAALKHVYLGGFPTLGNANVFTGTHADLTIHHHPDHAMDFANGNWSALHKNEVIRPFSEPVDLLLEPDGAVLRIRRGRTGAPSGIEDWSYTVERSSDLNNPESWDEDEPTEEATARGEYNTDWRTFDASASAAFYRVQAKPNFFGID